MSKGKDGRWEEEGVHKRHSQASAASAMPHLPGPGRIIQVQTPPSLSCGGGSEKQYELYHVARGVSFPETSKNTRFPVLNECGPVLVGSKITADGDCSHEIKGAYSLEGKL